MICLIIPTKQILYRISRRYPENYIKKIISQTFRRRPYFNYHLSVIYNINFFIRSVSVYVNVNDESIISPQMLAR